MEMERKRKTILRHVPEKVARAIMSLN